MSTIKIEIQNICLSTLSNSDGLLFYNELDNILSKGDIALISFANINTISSSFLNSSFGEIVTKYDYSVLRNRIKITHFTPKIAKVVVKYLDDLRHQQVS
jgi:hypothetical protein